MRHDPERDAACFLGGAMDVDEREAYSAHLLTCPDCWTDVEQARHGRSLAESLRTTASPELRDHVRGLIEAENRASRPAAPTRSRWLIPAALTAAAAAAVAVLLALGGGGSEPPSLREAVADFTAERLPGDAVTSRSAPDLSALSLQPVGAGNGSYAGLDVDGYAYRDPAGRRIVLYLSDDPFPEAPGAQLLAGKDGPWVAQRGDVIILCARLPHALLVVGEDDQLVRSAASALGVL